MGRCILSEKTPDMYWRVYIHRIFPTGENYFFWARARDWNAKTGLYFHESKMLFQKKKRVEVVKEDFLGDNVFAKVWVDGYTM